MACAALRQFRELGKTVILVTHELDIAANASQRLFLRDGLIDHIEGAA